MTPDESHAELLAACDEAIGAGTPLPELPDGGEFDGLARAVDCLHRLNRWKVGRAAARQVGRFQIVRELGRGGFGVVYLAFDPRLGRDVALKVPRADVLTADGMRERFHREARAAAGLDHPNIVPVYEAGEAGPACYIAAAYCPGPTLREWLRRRTEPVPFPTAAALAAALADGAGHAHARGIVHRDLKPANVLLVVGSGQSAVSSEDTVPSLPTAHCPLPTVPRITDFGLAKLADRSDAVTRTGAVLGTPSYMAPEQAEGKREVGPAADVYALGAVLYELLTGRPPFVGESDLDTLRQAGSLEPVPPSRLRLRLPRDLETVCLKCLEKDPRRRYATAAELAADLRRFLAGEPVAARRVGAVGRAWKRARRYPVAAGLLAVIVVLAIGGGVAVTVFWRQAEAALASEAAQRGRTEAALAEKLTILARIDWEANRIDRAADYLRQCPEAHRGREWRYLDRMCRAGVMAFDYASPTSPALAYSPDGRFVAATGFRDVKVWDLATRELVFAGEAEADAPRSFGFTADGRQLTRLGVAGPPAESRSMIPALARPLTSQRVGEPARLGLVVWDTGTWVRGWAAEFSSAAYRTAAAGPAGPLVAAAAGPLVRVENLTTGGVVEFPHGYTAVRDTAFNENGRYLLTAGDGGPIKVWDASTGRQLYAVPERVGGIGYYHPAREPLSRDGRRLVVFRRANAGPMVLTVWDGELGRELMTVRRTQFTTSGYRFSPDGRYFGLADGTTVRVWDLAAGREMFTLRGHDRAVVAIEFSPDGRRLVSAARGGPIRVWDVSPVEE